MRKGIKWRKKIWATAKEDQIHKESHSKMQKKILTKIFQKKISYYSLQDYLMVREVLVFGVKVMVENHFNVLLKCVIRSVKKFADFFGGNVVKFAKVRKSHWTQTYKWKLSGARAYECVEMMIEYMSQRRQEKYECGSVHLN